MTGWFNSLNGLADEWAAAMIRACWQGGVAIAVVWAFSRAFPRVSPRVRCWLWRLAYLKLLVALLWATPLDLALLPAQPARPAIMPGATATPLGEAPAPSMGAAQPAAATSARARAHPPLPTVASSLLVLWIAGLLWCGCRVAREWHGLRARLLTGRALTDGDLRSLRSRLSKRLALRQVPTLHAAEGAATPIVMGAMRPAIVLPSELLKDESRERLSLVLAHELAHLKRRDLLWGWLSAVAGSLFFFHPLVWLANRESELAREEACDELAILTTEADVGDYGEMLLQVASREHAGLLRTPVAVSILESYLTLKRRLTAMRHLAPLSRKRLMVAGAMVVTMSVVGVVPWHVVARAEEDGHRAGSALAQVTPKAVEDGVEPAFSGEERSGGDGYFYIGKTTAGSDALYDVVYWTQGHSGAESGGRLIFAKRGGRTDDGFTLHDCVVHRYSSGGQTLMVTMVSSAVSFESQHDSPALQTGADAKHARFNRYGGSYFHAAHEEASTGTLHGVAVWIPPSHGRGFGGTLILAKQAQRKDAATWTLYGCVSRTYKSNGEQQDGTVHAALITLRLCAVNVVHTPPAPFRGSRPGTRSVCGANSRTPPA